MTNIIKEIENEYGNKVIQEFEPTSNKLIKETIFYSCGIKKEFINEYDQDTSKKVKTTEYRYDGETVFRIEKYDKNTGKLIKEIGYFRGQIIDHIREFDKDTGKEIKFIDFQRDGKTINFIKEFDKDTGHLVKKIENFFDKEKITHIEENIYDKATGRLTKEIKRKPDDSIESIKEHRIDKVILIENFEDIERASDNAKSRFSEVEDLNSEIDDLENINNIEGIDDLIEKKNDEKSDLCYEISFPCDDLYPLKEVKFTKTINTEERKEITEFVTKIDDALYNLKDQDSIEDNESSMNDLEDAIDGLKQFCEENDIHIVEDTNADENWDEETNVNQNQNKEEK